VLYGVLSRPATRHASAYKLEHHYSTTATFTAHSRQQQAAGSIGGGSSVSYKIKIHYSYLLFIAHDKY
jgi:hypothetical protein